MLIWLIQPRWYQSRRYRPRTNDYCQHCRWWYQKPMTQYLYWDFKPCFLGTRLSWYLLILLYHYWKQEAFQRQLYLAWFEISLDTDIYYNLYWYDQYNRDDTNLAHTDWEQMIIADIADGDTKNPRLILILRFQTMLFTYQIIFMIGSHVRSSTNSPGEQAPEISRQLSC